MALEEAVVMVATADDVGAMVAWVVTPDDDDDVRNVYALCNVYGVFFEQRLT